MGSQRPNINLYTAETPNGYKISITLEELGLPYTTHALSFSKNEQKAPEFLKINPNGRIPALTDTFHDANQIRLFESGSIQQYLVDEYDKDHKISYPKGTREYYETNNWLFFLNAGVGPMQGQANHFTRYAPEKIPYGINRYQTETRRLYSVLDTHLAQSTSGYLVGDRCTIADIAHYGWIQASFWCEIDLSEFKNLEKWLDLMDTRPGVQRGRAVPAPPKHTRETMRDPEALKKAGEEGAKWVQSGMKEDQQKHSKV